MIFNMGSLSEIIGRTLNVLRYLREFSSKNFMSRQAIDSSESREVWGYTVYQDIQIFGTNMNIDDYSTSRVRKVIPTPNIKLPFIPALGGARSACKAADVLHLPADVMSRVYPACTVESVFPHRLSIAASQS